MKWENLKKNKCPSCNRDWLVMGNADFENKSITCKCGFSISEIKMAEIVSSLVIKGLNII